MKVFAHYHKSETTGNDYRWRTLLQFGTSWDIIGSVVMKNPGSAAPLYSVNEPTTLEQLKRLEQPKLFFDEPEYAWYSFSCDDTMQKVERLFCAYYKTSILNGVIQVFNLMNVRDPNIELALIKNNSASFPFSKTTESDIKSLVAPVYLGWGDLWKKQPFREDAEKIFTAIQNKLSGQQFLSSAISHGNRNKLSRKSVCPKCFLPEHDYTNIGSTNNSSETDLKESYF